MYVDGRFKEVDNINAYLISAPNVFIETRTKPLVTYIKTSGNRPADGGHLIIEENEYQDFLVMSQKQYLILNALVVQPNLL